MKEKNNYKGITLIALVITIIVLLILAGVSIATLTGDNGILTQASRSQEETRGGEVEEARNMWRQSKYINKQAGGQETQQSLEELINELVEKQALTEDERDIILGNSEKGIGAQYQITIGSHVIDFLDEDIELPPGLYETGTRNMIKSWDQLIEDGEVEVDTEDGGKYLWAVDLNGLRGDLVVKEGVQEISKIVLQSSCSAGGNPEGLTGITIPSTVKVVKGLTGSDELLTVTLKEGVEEIEDLSYCSKLTSVNIPSSVKIIGEYSGRGGFSGCISLKEITIPSTVEEVRPNAFYGWQPDQIINVPFKENELPSGWSEEWLEGCSATINYLK